MEWVFVLALAVLLLGPIVWAFTKGRNAAAPDEDALGSTGYGELIQNQNTDGKRP